MSSGVSSDRNMLEEDISAFEALHTYKANHLISWLLQAAEALTYMHETSEVSLFTTLYCH